MTSSKKWTAEQIYKQLSRVKRELAGRSREINKNLGSISGLEEKNRILSRKYSNQDKYRMKLEENLKDRLNGN